MVGRPARRRAGRTRLVRSPPVALAGSSGLPGRVTARKAALRSDSRTNARRAVSRSAWRPLPSPHGRSWTPFITWPPARWGRGGGAPRGRGCARTVRLASCRRRRRALGTPSGRAATAPARRRGSPSPRRSTAAQRSLLASCDRPWRRTPRLSDCRPRWRRGPADSGRRRWTDCCLPADGPSSHPVAGRATPTLAVAQQRFAVCSPCRGVRHASRPAGDQANGFDAVAGSLRSPPGTSCAVALPRQLPARSRGEHAPVPPAAACPRRQASPARCRSGRAA